MGRILRSVVLAGLAALFPALTSAAVVINEILPNPVGTDTGAERIEIYNTGPNAVDMTGWAIDDAATIDSAPVRARIPEDLVASGCSNSAIIGPGEFRVLMMQGGAAVLNNTGDVVYLVSNRVVPATVVHVVTYPGVPAEGVVWAALPNGSTNFDWRTASLCASNGNTGDIVAPATIADLVAATGAKPGEIRLTWTAPGDDGVTGTASGYDIKLNHSVITLANFAASADLERFISEPLPAAGGAPETLYVFGLNPDSTYYFAIQSQDEVPNTSGISNSPGIAPTPGTLLSPNLGFNTYFGNLHSHTSYSDGVQTPTDAFNFARFTAPTPLDYLAVSDHNHVSAGMQLPDYALDISEAGLANADGDFVALNGQEWGLAVNGHVNIIESPVLFGWDAGNYDVFVPEGDYASLYAAVLAHPPTSSPVILEWCHPGASDFGNFLFNADAKAAVHLMAVVNGPSTSVKTDESDIGNTGYDATFQNALRKGFRVSPTADQDNHNATWGAATQSRTAVLTSSKTKSNILNALAARRCYATQDHNVVVNFSAEGHAMGEVFTRPEGIRIAVQVSDPDVGQNVSEIELFRGITGTSQATRVAFNLNSNTLQWRDTQSFASGTEAHYYVKVRMASNANVWTGPVYVTYDPSFALGVGDGPKSKNGLALAASPNPARGPVTAEFTLAKDEAQASLGLYDLNGRLVRRIMDGARSAGVQRVVWDGRSTDGSRPKAGVYFLRLQTSLGSASQKVLVLQ